MYVKKLSDITDDMQIICTEYTFTESFENFKFSDNVHTLKLSYYNRSLNDINYPKNLKYLQIHCGLINQNIQMMKISSQCTKLEKLILDHCIIDNLVVPENLKTLVLYSSMFKNYDNFPHELFIISSYCIDDPKFEFVKQDDDKFHYIYLKCPRDHFIKAANN